MEVGDRSPQWDDISDAEQKLEQPDDNRNEEDPLDINIEDFAGEAQQTPGQKRRRSQEGSDSPMYLGGPVEEPGPRPESAEVMYRTEGFDDTGVPWAELSVAEKRPWKKKANKLKKAWQSRVAEYRSMNPDWEPPKKRSRKVATMAAKRTQLKTERDAGEHGGYAGDTGRDAGLNGMGDGMDDGGADAGNKTAYEQHLETLKSAQHKRRNRHRDADLAVDEHLLEAFVAEMREAARKDREAYSRGVPAVNCYKLLDVVCGELKRRHSTKHLLDYQLLDALRDWLVPFPGGVLPALAVRTKIYAAIKELRLHRQGEIKGYFEDSENRATESRAVAEAQGETDLSTYIGFCKVLMGLARHKSETRQNRQLLVGMIQSWVRPLVDQRIDFAESLEANSSQRPRNGQWETMRQQQRKVVAKQKRPQLVDDSKRNRARLPERPFFDFCRMPEARDLGSARDDKNERNALFEEKRKKVNKKLEMLRKLNKGGSRVTHGVSISGKARDRIF